MKNDTALTLGVFGAVALVGYLIYQHYKTTPNVTALSLAGMNNSAALQAAQMRANASNTAALYGAGASVANTLLGDLGSLFGGGSAYNGGNGTTLAPDYSQWNNAYDPNAALANNYGNTYDSAVGGYA
jgi:hypothetical protein